MGIKALIVDDDEDIRRIEGERISSLGHEWDGAGSAKEVYDHGRRGLRAGAADGADAFLVGFEVVPPEDGRHELGSVPEAAVADGLPFTAVWCDYVDGVVCAAAGDSSADHRPDGFGHSLAGDVLVLVFHVIKSL